jgi:mitogen-activated protein kinase 1/3
VIGTPSDADIDAVKVEEGRNLIRTKLMDIPRKNFDELFSVPPDGRPLSEDALNLLERMLEFNPDKRISALDALKHPYLRSCHDPRIEQEHIDPFDFSESEIVGKDINALREMIFLDIVHIRESLGHINTNSY